MTFRTGYSFPFFFLFFFFFFLLTLSLSFSLEKVPFQLTKRTFHLVPETFAFLRVIKRRMDRTGVVLDRGEADSNVYV